MPRKRKIVEFEMEIPRWLVVKVTNGPRGYVILDRHTQEQVTPPMTALQCRELALTWNTRGAPIMAGAST